MKKCKYCGAELPEEASFCHKCARSQIRTVTISVPRRGRWLRPLLAAVLAVALVFLGAGAHALLSRKPEPAQWFTQPTAPLVLEAGGPELEYGDYRLVLSFYENDGLQGIPTAERTVSLSEGGRMGAPTLLNVFDLDGKPAWDSFRQQIRTAAVELQNISGSQLTCTAPEPMADFSGGDLAGRLEYGSDAGENEIIWKIEMINGDILHLRQQFTVEELEILDIHTEDVPMETLEAVQRLIDNLSVTVEPNKVVNLHLPPVTYEGNLRVDRAVNLLGDESGETEFHGSVAFYSEDPETCEVHNIRFIGASGIGLEAHTSVQMFDCSFEGYDIGVRSCDEGWAAPDTCSFSDNGVGLQYDLYSYHFFDSEIPDCSFVGNDTALQILEIPGAAPLTLSQSMFWDNGSDLDNPAGYPVNIK